ncbi:hypothetical protein KJ652_03770 [Patescibacteria group bacterium]|nr:hypothetical protein [Patescibacteria group bacterium]MBU1123683.1 hypothetical protein [Patescibacteria group bacterium]MBU1911609.1 hypothetical protein [Patescibacteria group bacterium]
MSIGNESPTRKEITNGPPERWGGCEDDPWEGDVPEIHRFEFPCKGIVYRTYNYEDVYVILKEVNGGPRNDYYRFTNYSDFKEQGLIFDYALFEVVESENGYELKAIEAESLTPQDETGQAIVEEVAQKKGQIRKGLGVFEGFKPE